MLPAGRFGTCTRNLFSLGIPDSVSTLGTEGGGLSIVAAQEDDITVGDAEPEDAITAVDTAVDAAADAAAEAEAGAAGLDTQVLAIEPAGEDGSGTIPSAFSSRSVICGLSLGGGPLGPAYSTS